MRVGKTFHPEVQLCRGRKFALRARKALGLTFGTKRRKEQKTIQPEDSMPKGNEVQMTHETVWADTFSGGIFHELTRIRHEKQVGTGYKVSNVSA